MIKKGLKQDGYDKKTGRPEFEVLAKGNCDITLDLLGDSPAAKMWSHITVMGELDWSLSDAAEGAGISRTTLYKIWPMFEDNEFIIPSRVFKGVQLYKFNKTNYIANSMSHLISLFVHNKIQEITVIEDVRDKQAIENKKRIKKSKVKI